MSNCESKTWKVVVCGTGFGMFYIEAVKRSFPDFEIVGIVASGSERSKKCAENYGVRLYNSVDEVPDDIDAACVVVRSSSLGGAGTAMSISFLKRGIHVILEQPVHHEDLKNCFKEARKNNCCFMTGDLYLNMPEIRRYLQVCAFMRESGQKIEYIRAGSSVQAFYPFVEILQQLVPGGEVKLSSIGEQSGSFKQITGTLGSVPFSFQFNNDMNPDDPDNHMQILHSFCCFYPTGRLELVDTRGPLVWYPRLNMPWSTLNEGKLPDKYPDHMYESSVQVLTPESADINKPYYRFVEESWVQGIAMDLYKLREMSENRAKQLVKSQQEQKSSRVWNALTSQLGYAVLNRDLNPLPVNALNLREACILEEERNVESDE